MQQKVLKATVVLLFLTIVRGTTHAQNYEHIKDFQSDITINTDGTVDVIETIDYYFPDQRHGIFRDIPLTKENQDGELFKMGVEAVSVSTPNGTAYKYQDNSTLTQLSLKIGDPNSTITGTHTYVISYSLSGALTYFSDHDELFWNVTGNEWDVPILKSGATIKLPMAAAGEITANCFTGSYGSTQSTCSTQIAENRVQITSTADLDPREGLTGTVGFPKGIVAVLKPTPDRSGAWDRIIEILYALGAILYYTVIPLFFIIKALKKRKKTPEEQRVVAAWFDPPKTPAGRELTAGEVGVLYDRKGDVRDITATLIELAQKGYLKIVGEEPGKLLKKPTFALVQLKSFEDPGLLEYERYLLKAIFVNDTLNQRESLKQLGKRTGFGTKLQKTYKDITAQLLKDKLFAEDPYKLSNKWTVGIFLGIFFFNPLLLLASYLMAKSAKKTREGDLAWGVISSMRNFVKSQDKQLEFQAKNQMFFEKLLPFAIALGVEKVWIERFKDIQLAQPEWLETTDMGAFSYAYLMSSFNTSVSSAVSMSSTRSSSGFSSGFSGGGFSGGGGGGGGGGSW